MTGFAATDVQSFYFDFGPNNVVNRGNLTPTDKADANGHFWNNIHSTNDNDITAGSEFNTVRNSLGTTVDNMTVVVNGTFCTNGLSGGGGLMSPSADLLGDLAVETATEDYMFLNGNNVDNRAFTISGLNPDHAYTFRIFTSRKATDNRTGRFTIEGLNSFKGENQAAGTNLGGEGINQNNSTILVSEPVFPTAEGAIKITVSRVSGQYIPINCMSVLEQSGITRPSVDLSDRSYYFDFGATDKAANKCEITPSPDANGNHWNNITNTADGSKYADAGTVFSSLVDGKGEASALTLTLNDRFSTLRRPLPTIISMRPTRATARSQSPVSTPRKPTSSIFSHRARLPTTARATISFRATTSGPERFRPQARISAAQASIRTIRRFSSAIICSPTPTERSR